MSNNFVKFCIQPVEKWRKINLWNARPLFRPFLDFRQKWPQIFPLLSFLVGPISVLRPNFSQLETLALKHCCQALGRFWVRACQFFI